MGKDSVKEKKEKKDKKKSKAAEAARIAEASKAAEAVEIAETAKRTERPDEPIISDPSHRTKSRSEKEIRDLTNRLNRIEGQIRGIKRMVEEGSYCPDILVQVAAANAALNSFNKVLLAEHIRTCVAEDIREGREETVEELLATLQKLMK